MQIQIGNYRAQKESFLKALYVLKIKYDRASTAGEYNAINRVQQIVLNDVLDTPLDITLQGTLVPEVIRNHPFKNLLIKVELDKANEYAYFKPDAGYQMIEYIKEHLVPFKIIFYYNHSVCYDVLSLDVNKLSLVYIQHPGYSKNTKAKALVFIQSLLDSISVVPLNDLKLKGDSHEHK